MGALTGRGSHRLGRKALLGATLLLALAGGTAAQAQAISPAMVADAAERGDSETLRRAMADSRLMQEVADAGVTLDFLLAIAASEKVAYEIRQEAYRRAVRALEAESVGSGAPSPRQFEVLTSYAGFLAGYVEDRLLHLPPLGAASADYIGATGSVRRELDGVIDELSRMTSCDAGPCDTPSARFRKSAAYEVAGMLQDAASAERRAYAAYDVDASSHGEFREYHWSAAEFGRAEGLYRQALQRFQAGFPASPAAARIAELAARAGTRRTYTERVAARNGPDRPAPAPPPPPPPPPSPPPVIATVAALSTLTDLVLDQPGTTSALTSYQQQCQPAGEPAAVPPAAEVGVYFATTRRLLANPDERYERFFGSERDLRDGRLQTRYGKARISIPCLRRVGEIHRPPTVLVQLRPARVGTDFVLRPPALFPDKPAWLAAVGRDVAQSQKHEVLVYVHGFNNSFADAAYRAGQLHADLGIDGATVFYDWASRDSLFGYRDDRVVAESAEEADALAEVLVGLRNNGVSTVYLTAHSMGNRLLLRALQRIAARPDAPVERFQELVLGSADIEKDSFERLWPEASRLVDRTTLYASRHDAALWAAKAFTNPDQRIGDASPEPMVFPSVQTVDTSEVHGPGLGHDDFAGVGLDDVRGALWLSLAPDSRCVLATRRSRDDGQYWRITAAGTDGCDRYSFGDAVQLTRLAGSAQAANGWVSTEYAKRSDPGERAYLQRVVSALSRLIGLGRPRLAPAAAGAAVR